jgi:hypothetical protein
MIRAKWTFVAAALLTSTTALAQEAPAGDRFGQAGQFAISAERLFGVSHSGQSEHQSNGDEAMDSVTRVSFLSGPGLAANIYTLPRLGLDYFVIDGLTLGIAFGVVTNSTSNTDTPAGAASRTADGVSFDGVIVAPRIGYAYMFNDTVGIWPRGGFTYVGFGTKNPAPSNDETGFHYSAITMEVPLVLSPFPHMGFLIAPVVDIGVGGSRVRKDGATGQETTTDVKATELGLMAGMFVYI